MRRRVVAGSIALIANSWVLIPVLTTAGSYYASANTQVNAQASLTTETQWTTWSGLLRFLPFGTNGGFYYTRLSLRL